MHTLAAQNTKQIELVLNGETLHFVVLAGINTIRFPDHTTFGAVAFTFKGHRTLDGREIFE